MLRNNPFIVDYWIGIVQKVEPWRQNETASAVPWGLVVYIRPSFDIINRIFNNNGRERKGQQLLLLLWGGRAQRLEMIMIGLSFLYSFSTNIIATRIGERVQTRIWQAGRVWVQILNGKRGENVPYLTPTVERVSTIAGINLCSV